MDWLELETVERKRGEYELKRKQAELGAAFRERELQLKERQTRIAEKRFRLEREKARANMQALESKAAAGQALTEDDLRKVREIYGLYENDSNEEIRNA
jgi:hypothetical protein